MECGISTRIPWCGLEERGSRRQPSMLILTPRIAPTSSSFFPGLFPSELVNLDTSSNIKFI